MRLTGRAGLIAALLGATALLSLPLMAQDAPTETISPEEAAALAEASATADAAADDGLMTSDELDALFAPVALFPDALLAQVLLATTYPVDVMKADRWLTKNAAMPDQERSEAVAEMDWADPVKELAAGFPELVGRMAEHVDWTEQAGNAVVAQTDESLASLQRLRAQAKLNGYLEDNAAMTVEEEPETGDITISSANPEVVYVPQYTETVYTTPAPATPVYVTDDDDWDDWLATGAIVWGGAIILDEIFDDDHWDNGDYWHGGGNGNNNHIDWDGDINIDNGIDIGGGDRVNIGNGDNINIGDRPGLGGGDRPGLGGGAIAGGIAGGVAGGALNRPTTLPADVGRIGDVDPERLQNARDGNFNPSAANRDAAREKIKNHKATGGGVATLPAATSKGDRVGTAPSRPAAAKPATRPSTKPATRSPSVSKPKTTARPKATAARPAAQKPAYKPSNGNRARAASSRGKSSRGGRR